MKRSLIKILLCLLLVCVTAFCFTACAEDGKDGADGVSVEQIFVGEDGHLYVKLTGDVEYRDLGLVSTTSPEQEGYSKGLIYQANEDRTGYVINGIGTNTDKVLKVPETYNGLPVTGFAYPFFYSFYVGDNVDQYIEEVVFSKNTKFQYEYEYNGETRIEYYFSELHRTMDNLQRITIATDNPYYKSIDGVAYTKDGKVLLFYPPCKQDKTFNVPEGVEVIDNYGYYCHNPYVEKLTLPTTLKSIDRYVMSFFKSVKEIIVPDSVTSIGYQAFAYCTSLESVVIGNGVTSIEECVFQDCTSLTSITFNGTVAEWNAIEREADWLGYDDKVPATKVVCSDGEVAIG